MMHCHYNVLLLCLLTTTSVTLQDNSNIIHKSPQEEPLNSLTPRSFSVYFTSTIVKKLHVCPEERVVDALDHFLTNMKHELREVVSFNYEDTFQQVHHHICHSSEEVGLICDEEPPNEVFFMASLQSLNMKEPLIYPLRRGYSARSLGRCGCARMEVEQGVKCSEEDVEDLASEFLKHFPPELSSTRSTQEEEQQEGGPEASDRFLSSTIKQFDDENSYVVLGLSPSGVDQETGKPYDSNDIKKAYRTLIRKYHPDKNNQQRELATSITSKINNACDFLLSQEGGAGQEGASSYTTLFQQQEFKFQFGSTSGSFSFSFSF